MVTLTPRGLFNSRLVRQKLDRSSVSLSYNHTIFLEGVRYHATVWTHCSGYLARPIYTRNQVSAKKRGCGTSPLRGPRTTGNTHTLSAWCNGQAIKQSSPATPLKRQRGEEVQLFLILDLGTWWGWVVSVTPRPRFTPERTLGNH
jgi:hypothetical protein